MKKLVGHRNKKSMIDRWAWSQRRRRCRGGGGDTVSEVLLAAGKGAEATFLLKSRLESEKPREMKQGKGFGWGGGHMRRSGRGGATAERAQRRRDDVWKFLAETPESSR
ncbi:hypothetical protein GW17_00015967 [Ensete ventricosum]|nr:hypothetical protein GW17_00015967 [Ensete ventricosum]